MEIQLFNSIFFWRKYFKDLLKIFIIELKEKFYYNYLKLIILYPGLCSILLILGINILFGASDDIELPRPELKVYFFSNFMQTYMGTALSLASFEPNPEYLYLYRLERKIELINALIQKIKEKNPTHLNLDCEKSKFVDIEYFIETAVNHHSRLYLEFLYNAKFPLATKIVKFNSDEQHDIFIQLSETMLGKGTVQKKFDSALKIITVEGSPMLDKRAKYDCKLLFDPYVIKGQTRDLRGLTTFSEGFKNYSYVDLCVLEFYTGFIAWALILHYWILPEDINIVGKGSWTIGRANLEDYSILINGRNFNAKMRSSVGSAALDLIKVLLEIDVDTMRKEDCYRLAIIAEALRHYYSSAGELGQRYLFYVVLEYRDALMRVRHLGYRINLSNIEKYYFYTPEIVAVQLINDLENLILYAR
jgi:hypothetical protein